ncbi:MAG: hypothetical protein NVSMB3_06870 [Acidobacteriaceae bacterium]
MLVLAQGRVWAQGTGVAGPPEGPGLVAGETRMFPLAEVRRGMKGVAYTVFEGVKPERMEVEILGVLKDSLGPGRDMILARLVGVKPEFTGVVAGMSGSPVYLDGRLVGALSYRIGQFSKEPIAGITPIGQMLEVRDGVAVPVSAPRLAAADSAAGQAGMQAMETPVVFGGFSQEAVERFGDRFKAMGMTPVAGLGGMDAKAVQPEPLTPGSAVSAILVEGDLSITGTCTVTYVDAKRLLACGHPITQTGAVDMPMTKAEVVATLPSPLNAFKIVNATEEVGAFTEDRASAILGRFGARARMIPVQVEVSPGAGGAAKTYHLRVVDNRDLTPQAMLVSVYQTMQQTNTAAAETSWRVSGEIGVARRGAEGQEGMSLRPVRMQGMLAPSEFNSGAINVALYLGDRFTRVYSNSQEQPVVTGVRLRLEAIAERRIAALDSARLSRTEASAGERVEVEAVLRPYGAAARSVRIPFQVPATAVAGPMRVLVSDGAAVDRLLAPAAGAARALSLADAVAQADGMHANDRLYVTLLDHSAQAVLDSTALEAVPLSMANVLEPLKEAQRMRLTGESVAEAGSMAVDEAVSGSQVLTLTVR